MTRRAKSWSLTSLWTGSVVAIAGTAAAGPIAHAAGLTAAAFATLLLTIVVPTVAPQGTGSPRLP